MRNLPTILCLAVLLSSYSTLSGQNHMAYKAGWLFGITPYEQNDPNGVSLLFDLPVGQTNWWVLSGLNFLSGQIENKISIPNAASSDFSTRETFTVLDVSAATNLTPRSRMNKLLLGAGPSLSYSTVAYTQTVVIENQQVTTVDRQGFNSFMPHFHFKLEDQVRLKNGFFVFLNGILRIPLGDQSGYTTRTIFVPYGESTKETEHGSTWGVTVGVGYELGRK